MLVTQEMATRAMKLGTRDIERAFANNDYSGTVISTAEFTGINQSRQFVYKVTGPDESGEEDHLEFKVYVYYNSLGQLVADY